MEEAGFTLSIERCVQRMMGPVFGFQHTSGLLCRVFHRSEDLTYSLSSSVSRVSVRVMQASAGVIETAFSRYYLIRGMAE